MIDVDLDTRLRNAYRDLERSTGERPFSDPAVLLRSPARPSRTLPLTIATACSFAALLAGLLLITWNRTDRTPSLPTADSVWSSATGESVWGDWQVSAVRVDGQPIPNNLHTKQWAFTRDGGCDAVGGNSCEDGLLSGHDGCNQFVRSLTVEATTSTIRWGSYFHSETMACSGGLATAMDIVSTANEISFVRSSTGLTLTASDVEIELAPWGTPAPLDPSLSTLVVTPTVPVTSPDS